MNKRLKLYREFIDDLTKIRNGVLHIWVTKTGWPKLPENDKYNNLLDKLNKDEKTILAEMIQQSRDGGIHDTLVYLSEQINLNNLRLSKEDTEFAIEPYGTELFWDWTARCDGSDWPDHQLSDEYK